MTKAAQYLHDTYVFSRKVTLSEEQTYVETVSDSTTSTCDKDLSLRAAAHISCRESKDPSEYKKIKRVQLSKGSLLTKKTWSYPPFSFRSFKHPLVHEYRQENDDISLKRSNLPQSSIESNTFHENRDDENTPSNSRESIDEKEGKSW